jgi:hypothetical protein
MKTLSFEIFPIIEYQTHFGMLAGICNLGLTKLQGRIENVALVLNG